MSNIAYGSSQNNLEVNKLKKKDFQYEYPDGLDWKPGSKLHERIKLMLLEKASESASVMSNRFDSWNQQDLFLSAYKRPDEEEKKVVAEDDRKPVSIVFPYSYAILETLLSYMMSAFFRSPIFRYEGNGPDDVMGSILLEQVVNLHCNKFRVMLNLHTMFRDAFVYGIGPVAPIWKQSSNGLYEGNALLNIDPYRYLPDTNVPADKIQEGEYVGWASDTNYMDLLSEEEHNEDMFNVQYLSLLKYKGTSIYEGDNSARDVRTGVGRNNNSQMKPVTEIPMYVKLIPKDWGLGDGKYPEKWLFRLAADAVIITARKTDFDHSKFPTTTAVPDFDGYSATPLSRLEILGGLQGVLDWLFNSHIANVRKAINDMIIYDPYLINSKDISNPAPGKLIRTRRPAWGKGVAGAVEQLKVNDITSAHMGDSSFVVQWMQKIGATDDAAMGSLRAGGPDRLTKAEFQGTASGAVSRLERIAKIVGLQSMQDIGEFFADHTQQMMSDDTYVKIGGKWENILMEEYNESIERGRMKVSPFDLDVFYDVVVRDGSVPGGNYSEVWLRMFDTLAQHPELAQNFDTVKIFKHIARNAGAKNVNEFVRRGGDMQAGVMPNEEISDQVQRGNLVPINGGG